MTTEDSAATLSPETPAAGSSPVVQSKGSLAIETEPSPLAFRVLDPQGRPVAHGVSPLTVSLDPGLYAVVATQPDEPDLVGVVRVAAKSDRTIRLSNRDPKLTEVAVSAFFDVVDRYHKVEPLPRAAKHQEATTQRPFWIRFQQLTDWTTAKALVAPDLTATIVGDRTIVDMVNPWNTVVFAQLAMGPGQTINVALPPSGAKPLPCQLVVSSTDEGLSAYARLATPWANAAVRYMAHGYIEEARKLVESGKPRDEEKLGLVAALLKRAANYTKSRLEDPCAALVPRYLGLRTGEDTIFNTLGDTFLDNFQTGFADGKIISAEVAARQRHYLSSAQRLNEIKPGTLPVFTEGFSLLVQRLRELIDLEPDVPDEKRPGAEDVKKLKSLLRTISRWAFHLDLTRPTVTFPGPDLTRPDSSASADLSGDNGWIRIPQM